MRPDASIVSAIQGDSAETRCGEAIIAMLESSAAERGAPEGLGRVHPHICRARGALPLQLYAQRGA